jgi:paraquat-inducible protein A
MTGGRTAVVALLLTAAAVTLGLGLVGPCMTVVPRLGPYTGWVELLRPDQLRPTTYSILSGIAALRDQGHVGIAALLFGFSVIFPVLKLAAMAWGAAALRLGVRPHLAVTLSHHLGKFSMLDVFVVGLLVLAIKGLPGGSEVRLGWGIGAFTASVGMALVGSALLHGVRPARGQGQ